MDFENFIYKDMKLPIYCEIINVSLGLVKNIYRKLRRTKTHETKTNEELLTYVMDHIFELIAGMNYKLWYHNEPLMVFCQEHPDQSYDCLVGIISKARLLNPDRTVDDILDEYFATEHKSYIR